MPPLALIAGGAGTRLRAVLPRLPKSMVEVAGEPFISRQLKLLKKEGISRVVICAGYLGEQIRDFVQEGTQFGLSVTYSFDGEKPLGTGGALRRALPDLGDLFWVLYGDSYLDVPFQPIFEYFLKGRKKALMTVYCNQNRWDKSNVLFNNGKVLNYLKKSPLPEMRHIDYGLSLMTKSAFEPWCETEVFDLADVQSGLIREGEMLGYEVTRRFYEVGSPRGLEEIRAFFEKKR